MGIENLPIDVECEGCSENFETTVDEFQLAKEAREPLLCSDCYAKAMDEQAEANKPLKRCFEYKHYALTTMRNNRNLPVPKMVPVLVNEKDINELGSDGWELVAIFNSDGIFKREYFSKEDT